MEGRDSCVSASVKHSPSVMHWACFLGERGRADCALQGSVTEKKPTNLLQLKRYTKDAWKAIPKGTIEYLVDSVPSRIEAVIAAQGGANKILHEM
jgi:hypothetical protein